MPKDYGILGEDAGSGLLPWSRASKRLAASRNYWVHTARSDGRPHVKPVWGLWFEGRFYFGTSPKSVSGLNMSKNPSVVVHLESGDDVVILEGTTEAVSDPILLSRLDEAYRAKYSYHLVG
jgi:general stress protein 26